MSRQILQMPARTYVAKRFQVPWHSKTFQVAGTLDGFIDLATPEGTYPLSVAEAIALGTALSAAVADVGKHCLYERDALLRKP